LNSNVEKKAKPRQDTAALGAAFARVRWRLRKHSSGESARAAKQGGFQVDFKKQKTEFIDNITSSTAQGGGGSFKNRKPIGEVGCCESGMAERSH